jgi:hypothetical protein
LRVSADQARGKIGKRSGVTVRMILGRDLEESGESLFVFLDDGSDHVCDLLSENVLSVNRGRSVVGEQSDEHAD